MTVILVKRYNYDPSMLCAIQLLMSAIKTDANTFADTNTKMLY